MPIRTVHFGLLAPALALVAFAACGSDDPAASPSPVAPAPTTAADGGGAPPPPPAREDASVVESGADAQPAGCSDTEIGARTDAVSAAAETVHSARFSRDGKAVYFTYSKGAPTPTSGIRRVDLCGRNGGEILTSPQVGVGLSVAANDVGHFQLGDTFHSAPMQIGATSTAGYDASILFGNIEVALDGSSVHASIGGALFRVTANAADNVTEAVLGTGRTLYNVNGRARGFRVSPDGKKLAALSSTGSGSPRVVVYELGTQTRRLLDFKDDVATPGLRDPAALAWLPDSKTLLAVSFKYVGKVDATIETPQIAPTVAETGFGPADFDASPDGKHVLYVKNGSVFVRLAK